MLGSFASNGQRASRSPRCERCYYCRVPRTRGYLVARGSPPFTRRSPTIILPLLFGSPRARFGVNDSFVRATLYYRHTEKHTHTNLYVQSRSHENDVFFVSSISTRKRPPSDTTLLLRKNMCIEKRFLFFAVKQRRAYIYMYVYVMYRLDARNPRKLDRIVVTPDQRRVFVCEKSSPNATRLCYCIKRKKKMCIQKNIYVCFLVASSGELVGDCVYVYIPTRRT